MSASAGAGGGMVCYAKNMWFFSPTYHSTNQITSTKVTLHVT